jgi:DNA-directed RNA polymerase
MDRCLQALNLIQETPWKVNQQVLSVAQEVWDSKLPTQIFPLRDPLVIPPFPKDQSEEVQKQWKRMAADIHNKNREIQGQRSLVCRTLEIAQKFSKEREIYFPHSFDFRGRVYPLPSGLSPQGADLSRGLLTFAHGKPIDDDVAEYWLAVHGANLWGEDKVSLDDRRQWVDDHAEMIISCALDPLNDRRWMDADKGEKAWQFLAWCVEWNSYLEQGRGFLSHLPVSVDGSCNGIQHFSAMLRDPVGGAAVNLIPSDKPQDIYAIVAEIVRKYYQNLGSDDSQRWLKLGITRKLTKRPVMVLPYGGTRLGTTEFVRDYVRECLNSGMQDPWPDKASKDGSCKQMATQIWLAIGESVVAAREAMSWLRSSARAIQKAGHQHIEWTSPSGFPCLQRYHKTKSKTITMVFCGIPHCTKFHSDSKKPDRLRHRNAISPNVVHSLDASALVETVIKCSHSGITSFAAIHDSYGTHAADMDLLGHHLRQAFIEVHSRPALQVLHEQWSKAYPKAKLPDLPELGSLDLDVVLDSDFFFA